VRAAVVGHVEWVEFAHVDHVPRAGEIVHATDSFEEPAGGGAVAAVQLARLAGHCQLFTALGDDAHGARSSERLSALDVRVEAAPRDEPTRRAFTFLDAHCERTITTLGERLQPRGSDALPWRDLSEADGVYVTAADVEAIRAARESRVMVATSRAGRALHEAGVRLDALVFSDLDELESGFARALEPRPALLVATRGSEGGRYETDEGQSGTWDAVPPPGPISDSYGCGDSFAASLTYALARGDEAEPALRLAAQAGALCMTGRGPYERQLGR
jgi:ribokinase